MKAKNYFLTLFTGIFIGLVLSSWAAFKFTDFLAPVGFSFAQTKNFITPVAEAELIKTTVRGSSNKEVGTSGFARLLAYNQVSSSLSSLKSVSQAETKKKEDVTGKVKGESVVKSETSKPKAVQPGQAISQVRGKKTIAFLGDSMTDVMGTDMPYLRTRLKSLYPQIDFTLLNYGVGAENIEQGLARINSEYNYKDRHYPALTQVNPDIVVVESFAYNPFSESSGELNRHWSVLTKIIDELKAKTKAKIMIMAVIAPSKQQFGKGPGGVNWPDDLAFSHAQRINGYLQNALNFAASAGLPSADAYHPSLLASGEGNPAYVSSHDHIHQSESGNVFLARVLSDKLAGLNWIN